MRDLSCFLLSLLVLSCSQDPPLSSPSVSDEQSGPWQTVSINGVTYQCVDAKATATRSDLLIAIPIRARLRMARFTFPVRWSLLDTPTRLILLTSKRISAIGDRRATPLAR